MTESRGVEEFERLHALTLPPVMSRADTGSAGLRSEPSSTRWLYFYEKPRSKYNHAAAFASFTDGRPPALVSREIPAGSDTYDF